MGFKNFPTFFTCYQFLILKHFCSSPLSNSNLKNLFNRFVLHTLQRNITHSAGITRKTNIKLGILKKGELEKNPILS